MGILAHMKKIFVSPWEIGKVKIDSLAFLTLAHILTSGIGFLNDFQHIFREKKCYLHVSVAYVYLHTIYPVWRSL